MKLKSYIYKAIVKSVYDGDTITVDIDLGLGVWVRGEKLRLYGINAPEIRGKEKAEGIKSRDTLRGLIDRNPIIIETIKDKKGKYGRYIAKVYIEIDGKIVNVCDYMVEHGGAEYKEY